MWNGILSYQWQLKGKQLIVQGGDLQGSLVLQRVSYNQNVEKATAKNGSAQTPQQLVGKWCLASNFSANAGGGSSRSSCFTSPYSRLKPPPLGGQIYL